jgi:uncharacterized sporulation protein YeaH/YhbH (DUF444 family)
MSTFKQHKTSADRSASDRRRHKQKIEKAIREGVYHIVAEESIIGEEGKKKIRIPVRGLNYLNWKEKNIRLFNLKSLDVTGIANKGFAQG